MNLDALTQAVIGVAREAGTLILEVYARSGSVAVDHKEDHSPLTQADLASHQHILASLQEMTPDYPVLSEESATIPYAERSHWQTYWLVDPLDGTKEFIKRNGEFCVLIALIHQHQPVLGVVYAPVLDTVWFASLGNGAFKQVGEDEPSALLTREPGPVLTIVGSRSHATADFTQFLEKLGPHELLSIGSLLKACRVAEGSADLYPRFGPTSEWDTAAAQIIVEEAGGLMVQLDGEPLVYNTRESLLNPRFMVSGSILFNWQDYLG